MCTHIKTIENICLIIQTKISRPVLKGDENLGDAECLL